MTGTRIVNAAMAHEHLWFHSATFPVNVDMIVPRYLEQVCLSDSLHCDATLLLSDSTTSFLVFRPVDMRKTLRNF